MRPHIADHRRANQEAVGVVIVAPRFTIDVVNNGGLGGVANDGEILFVRIRDEQVIAAHRLAHVVQSAVGVFFHPPEISEVVLEPIVVTNAKQTHADRHVLKQETAKIRSEWLDADAHRIEIEAI